MTVWALTLLFVAGLQSDALPETGNGLARGLAARCKLAVTVDPGLSWAAERHGRAVLQGRASAPEGALRAGGLGDPVIWPVVGVGPERGPLYEQSASRCPEPGFGATHAGAAWVQHEGRWAAVVFYSRRWVDWGPAAWRPRFIATGPRLRPFTSARVAWLQGCSRQLLCDRAAESAWDDDGPVARVELPSADVVEVLGDTPRGPVVLGLWVRPGLDPSPPTARGPVLAWQALRRERGLPAGRPSPALMQAARRHAKAICREGRAAHVDAQGRRPADRAGRAGWRGPVAENVAVARSLDRALGNLLLSPSHHATQVDPRVRAYGFGLVEGPQRTCLVQLFGYR